VRRTWAIAIKEIKQVSRDPISLLMLIGMPMLMLVLYGYALNFDVEDVALAVQDRDLSSGSRELVDRLIGSNRFELVATLPPGSDIQRVLERGAATAVLVIPEDFGRRLAAGESSEAQLLIDGVDSNTATTVLGYVNGIAAGINASRNRDILRSQGNEQILEAAINYQPRVWYNPEMVSSLFLVPGLIAFLLMFTAVLSTALSVVREKERGTLEQLRVKPLDTSQILLGKLLPYLAISLIGVVMILVAARVLFGVVVRGPYLDLFFATCLFLIGALGWGLLISTIADSQAVAFQIGVLSALLPTLLLSGFLFPIRNMPVVLRVISHVVPARYYLAILRGIIVKGSDLSPFWDQMAYLGIYTFLVLTLAAVRFKRQEG
jgi:ABC-2 type transport system permease protein